METRLANNRKAFHDYQVLERVEAGIELQGTEVKSIKAGHVSLAGAFARMKSDEVVLYNLNVLPYECGNRFNHEPDRPRRLLLHRKEIAKIKVFTQEKGCTLIPLEIRLRHGWIKVELGVCKGKQLSDKRETLRRRTADREAARVMAAHRR
jgi:SsrA-binding protein